MEPTREKIMEEAIEKAIQSTQCKSWAALRVLKADIKDSDVIALYKTLRMQIEEPLLYKQCMTNVWGADYWRTTDDKPDAVQGPICPWFETFYKLVNHEVKPLLRKQNSRWDELGKYHYGYGRSLLGISKLLSEGIIRKDQANNAIAQLFEPLWVGIELEDYILRSTIFQDEDDSALQVIVDQVIQANPKIVLEYKAGKEKVIGALVGQVMKQLKADPVLVNELLKKGMNK